MTALIQDGKVIKSECLAGGENLLTSAPQAADPAHPSISRLLPPAPNKYSVFSELAWCRRFTAIKLGISEAECQKILGKAVSVSEIKDAAHDITSSNMNFFRPASGEDALGADDGVLIKKNIFAGNRTSSGSSGDKDEQASRYGEYVISLP